MVKEEIARRPPKLCLNYPKTDANRGKTEIVMNGDIQGVLKVSQEGFKQNFFQTKTSHKNIHKLYQPVSISNHHPLCENRFSQFPIFLLTENTKSWN